MTNHELQTSGDSQPPYEPPRTLVGAAYEDEPLRRHVPVNIGGSHERLNPNQAIRDALAKLGLIGHQELRGGTVLSVEDDGTITEVVTGAQDD